MKSFKKLFALVLSVALISSAITAGTIAYLQDADSDVNVMTLGNVKIEQHEYERVVENGTYKTDTIDNKTSYVLQDFTQAKPLYPIVGDPNEPGNSPAYAGYDETTVRMSQVDSYGGMQVFAGKNAQDKFVTVENTGKSDAYVRTIVAIEIGSTDGSKIMTSARAQKADETGTQPWISNSIGAVVINGNTYRVVEYVYRGASDVNRHVNGVLPAGDTTYPSLCQVYLKHNATNEDMVAIDGNGNGTLDILVLSQAVQVEGFADAKKALDTAFGETSKKVAEWFKDTNVPSTVNNPLDLHKSTTKTGEFILGSNIKTSDGGNDARYGYGYEYIIRNKADYTFDLNGKNIVHDSVNENPKHDALTYLFVANHAGTKLTINGEGKVYSHNSEGYACAVQGKDGTLITINGGDYYVDNGIAVWAGAGAHIVINGGSYVNAQAKTDHELIYSSGGVIDIYGGFFHNTDGNYTLNIEDRNRATGFINVYGGTYVNFDPSTGGQDPNNIKVADGYEVVSETQANGDVWYTVVAK